MCDLSSLDLRRVRLALLDLNGDRPPLRAGGDGLREDEEEELRVDVKFRTEYLNVCIDDTATR